MRVSPLTWSCPRPHTCVNGMNSGPRPPPPPPPLAAPCALRLVSSWKAETYWGSWLPWMACRGEPGGRVGQGGAGVGALHCARHDGLACSTDGAAQGVRPHPPAHPPQQSASRARAAAAASQPGSGPAAVPEAGPLHGWAAPRALQEAGGSGEGRADRVSRCRSARCSGTSACHLSSEAAAGRQAGRRRGPAAGLARTLDVLGVCVGRHVRVLRSRWVAKVGARGKVRRTAR